MAPNVMGLPGISDHRADAEKGIFRHRIHVMGFVISSPRQQDPVTARNMISNTGTKWETRLSIQALDCNRGGTGEGGGGSVSRREPPYAGLPQASHDG